MKPPARPDPHSSGATAALWGAGSFFRAQVWVWPLIAAVLLAFVGFWLRLRMEGASRLQIAAHLQTILRANTEALQSWAAGVQSEAELLAEDAGVAESAAALIAAGERAGYSQAALLNAPQLAALRARLNPWLDRRGFSGFVVLDPLARVLASARDPIVGMQSPPGYAESLKPCLAGRSLVTPPFPSVGLLPDAHGNLRAGVPTMFAAAPIRSTGGMVIAVLGLRIAPEKDFTRILATARAGRTGETYAFGRNGLIVSQSRFDDSLKRLGLIPDAPDSLSLLTLELRDPLTDLSRGRVSPRRRAELPMTRAVTEALAGRSGSDAVGYRNYLGATVVGAWTWLPGFDLGLVTELSAREAFGPLWTLRLTFWFLFALLLAGSALIFVLMRAADRLQAAGRQAALKARQLGQYALGDKIGSGAFGSVYRGRHALMRRPVAVKLLELENADDPAAARFEREVQLTSQLTHPNTIALYDYGRTPEGVFYYAMEYLDGLTLDQLVKQYGAQPEGRVIFILAQVCGSLTEAHETGLVHRDIKPANIFLTRRGGLPDFVKVLDFGLVKSRDTQGQLELTAANATLGTPLYMSPEAVERPLAIDARSDLYSVGAVGYFLLTGERLFDCATLGEVLVSQVKRLPPPPSARLGKLVSSDLESLLMSCLAKDPALRPPSARSLGEALGACQSAGAWTRALAEEWWKRHAAAASDKAAILPPAEAATRRL